MQSNKSQAALEFLMTYGWAILVVLVAVGALAYFGVLSPDRFLPSKCSLPAGFSCLDHIASSSDQGIGVVLKNNLGYDVTSVTVTASGCTSASTISTLRNDGVNTFTPGGCTLTSGQKYSGQLSVTYTRADTGISHTMQGTLITKVE